MTLTCNLCGNTEFEDFSIREKIRCTRCQSLERTRMMALYLEARLKLRPGAKVLHIAPEKGLWQKFSSDPNIAEYVVADYNPELYDFVDCTRIDLCHLDDWPSDAFDLIVHSHVLEHTYCNIAYSLFHLHRMLAPEGRHIFIVPFTRGRYEESFQVMGSEERTRRFGQWDHVRRFGVEDIADTLGSIVTLPEAMDATAHFAPEVLRRANIPAHFWTGLTAATVLDLAKTDYKLA